MLNALLSALFGCAHERTTFPLTPTGSIGASNRAASVNGTYVACLDCGKEFRYDWAEMRIGRPVMRRPESLVRPPT